MEGFEDRRNNPFQFKHLQLCHSLGELARVPEPKVVLASGPDLQSGFSRDLFIQWCGNPKNSVILTNRTSPGTLARQLIEHAGIKTITLEIRRRVRLDGAELEDFLKKEKEKENELTRQKEEQAKREREEMESSSESEDEMEMEVGGGGGGTGAGGGASKGKHDLMMKSGGKSKSSFFKQAKKAYPMFPVVEEKIKWDDYGEIIRMEDYIIQDNAVQEEEKMDMSKADESMTQDMSEVPTKCIAHRQNVNINANIQFIDFEGRSDGESIRKILGQIKPRQLILVRGGRDATENLADHARNAKDMVQGKVFVPTLTEITDATTDSHIYQVRLKDSVVSALQFSKAKDTEVAWIDAMLDLRGAKTDTSAMTADEKGAREEQEKTRRPGGLEEEDMDDEDGEGEGENKEARVDLVPTLIPLPFMQSTGHSAVYINEPKLSDFKQVLVREGIQAEFSGGVLICNNMVAVRRNEAGKMQVEGCLCSDFYKVRELLYNQYAIV